LARLNLAYEDVSAIRPDIVFCQAQGFRSDSERADEPAYDDIIQAESGLADAARRSGRDPQIAPTIMADKICGLMISQAVVAALFHRLRTGSGQRVEIPMLDVMRAFLMVEHGAGAVADPVNGQAGYSRVLNAARGPQRTQDGWICILPYSKADFSALFRTVGLDQLADDPRIADPVTISQNAGFLYEALREIVATRKTAAWLQFCHEHHIPVGAISTLDEVAKTMPVREHPFAGPYRSVPSPMVFSNSSCTVDREAPIVGQDTEALLIDVGFDPEEIRALRDAEVVQIA
jgi:crotonobetainyl-CoA:carnitine CoA-transferase CaiB-like acyl-CoA transferase